MNKEDLLIIFTRNPELGKVKTRLAATIGKELALEIYTVLLKHTCSITKNLGVSKEVHYSVAIRENDIWDSAYYRKKQQFGGDLGNRMQYAFEEGFKQGYQNIIIIGSDMYDLSQANLEEAFDQLKKHDFVLGPATDGGYYLLGMRSLEPKVFKNKDWGTDTVLEQTKNDLFGKRVKFLEEKNDIDNFDDIKEIPFFVENYLKNF